MCYCVNSKGPNFRVSQSTDSDGLAAGYVKREKTLFFDGYDSLLWVITPLIMGRNDIKTQYFKPLWGICNHETEKNAEY